MVVNVCDLHLYMHFLKRNTFTQCLYSVIVNVFCIIFQALVFCNQTVIFQSNTCTFVLLCIQQKWFGYKGMHSLCQIYQLYSNLL